MIYRSNIVISALIALSSLAFFDVPVDAAPDSPKPAVKKAKESSSQKNAPASTKDKGKKNVSTNGEWNDPDKLQKSLAARVSKKFKSWSGTEINSFLKDEENCLMLANWELIRAMKSDEEAFKKFRLSLKKTATRNFIVKFANDGDWLEGYLYSAPSDNAVDAVNLLRAFSEKDPEIFTVPAIKKIATGVVGEFSRRNWIEDEFETENKELAKKNGPTRVFKRFKFYADSWREGRLNALFDTLDYWDTRIVVGVTGRTNNRFFGSEESLRWGQDNVKLPEAGYGSSRDIFQMPYRLWNKVGDSVHRDEYYAPFNKWYKRVQLKEAQEVGCVCGGVSHFGATAACANGIPAVTMGEPGHCAFAVRIGGKWRDNNSVSWDRGVHWRLWEDENDWSFLHLTQSLFEDKKNTPNSFRTAVLARISASAKTPDDARTLAIFEHALEIQPLNFPVWREYLTFAKDKKKDDKKFWKDAHKKISEAFNPALPEVGAVLLGKYVYPNLLPLTQNDDEKIALFAEFWGKTDGFGMAGRWDCESVWDYEIKTLGDGAGAGTYSAFRKNYDAKNPSKPGDDPAKKRYKEKIGASAGANKDFSKHFENWKNGTPRK